MAGSSGQHLFHRNQLVQLHSGSCSTWPLNFLEVPEGLSIVCVSVCVCGRWQGRREAERVWKGSNCPVKRRRNRWGSVFLCPSNPRNSIFHYLCLGFSFAVCDVHRTHYSFKLRVLVNFGFKRDSNTFLANAISSLHGFSSCRKTVLTRGPYKPMA